MDFTVVTSKSARFIGELLFNREVRQASAQRLLRAHATLCVGGGVFKWKQECGQTLQAERPWKWN